MASDDAYIKGKDKRQLVNELKGTGVPGSPVHEQMKMAIFVGISEDLEKAIKKLSTKISALDVAVKLAAIVGAVATVLVTYKTFFS